MLAYQQNNISRALAAAAGTVGEYAKAAHEDRIAQGRMQFEQMLEDNRMKASAAQHDADKAQQQSQFDTTNSLNEKRFDQLQKQQAATDAETQHWHQVEASNDSARLGMEGMRTKAEVAKSASDKTDQIQTRQTAILQSRQTALERQADYATDRRQAALQKLSGDQNYQLAAPAQQQAMQDAVTKPWDTILQANQVQLGKVQQAFERISPIADNVDAGSGTPGPSSSSTPSASPAPAGAQQVRKDAQGRLWIKGPDGQPIPYNPGADASGTGADASMANATDPTQTDPTQTDPTQTDPTQLGAGTDPSTIAPPDPSLATAPPTPDAGAAPDPSLGAAPSPGLVPLNDGTDPNTA